MLKKTGLLTAVLAAALATVSVYAQDAKLVEAAKKEGKVTVYGSLETDSADAVFKVFRQKTGIELEYWRASSTKVMDRALTESRGKTRLRCDSD
jgi:iron(III) transport system substrate-binding protein